LWLLEEEEVALKRGKGEVRFLKRKLRKGRSFTCNARLDLARGKKLLPRQLIPTPFHCLQEHSSDVFSGSTKISKQAIVKVKRRWVILILQACSSMLRSGPDKTAEFSQRFTRFETILTYSKA
jgi:hypothetical protein